MADAVPTSNLGFDNFFTATLTGDITASSTDILMDAVPTATEGFLVIDPDSSSHEIIYYNSKTALKVICPDASTGRGQGGTTAGAHSTGSTVIMAPVAEHFEALKALFTTTPQGYSTVATTVSAVTNNGNRSYSLAVNDDVTATLSPGMRLRTTRTVAAPTQCTSLNGTTQYYSCPSATVAADMTFTDDFVVGAWIKMSAYPSAAAIIMSRQNGTSGWDIYINTDGTVNLTGYSGGLGNNRAVYSYQSIPLNKWVYVAAQLDMSAHTATTTTSYIMLDGVDVPAAVRQGGTNPTALIQAGNFEIGSRNGGLLPFPGKIAQAFVSSAKITQANVRTLMSQGLTASLISTNSIISAYSFNNDITDLNTTSANNLTANGSAVATNADSPFGGQGDGTISSTLDYGIVQAVSASTITVQVAEGCTIPTSGGVSAVSYSTQKVPYNFPGSQDKWKLESTIKVRLTQTSPVTGTWYNLSSTTAVSLGAIINLPIGKHIFGYELPLYIDRAAAGGVDAYVTLSTANNSETDSELTAITTATGGTATSSTPKREKPVSITSATPYYLNFKSGQAGAATLICLSDLAAGKVYAINAYL